MLWDAVDMTVINDDEATRSCVPSPMVADSIESGVKAAKSVVLSLAARGAARNQNYNSIMFCSWLVATARSNLLGQAGGQL